MAHRRNIQSKKRSYRVKRTKQPIIKQNPTENLDDETKLAKRHLTKEMWQLVSIAVKRMADELVSISNNQPTATRIGYQEQLIETNNLPGQSNITNTGAGDEPLIKEKSATVNESVKRCTSPLQVLEPTVQMKKKGNSNNAIRRAVKSKIQNKSSKKNGKVMTQRLHHNHK